MIRVDIKRKRWLFTCLVIMIVIFSSAAFANSENVWELTQYSDDSGNQGMFYSLINKETGEMILVDGGWKENAGQVSKVIDENGGHVTAWFLTHYHNDHCDAFNALWEKYKDQIDVIYCTPLSWEEFEPLAQPWDSPETFLTFQELTKDSGKVVTLNRGDQFEIAGLKVEVFNAYDNYVKYYGDWANNSSLVFKISASEQSVLFLGDMHNEELGKKILDMFDSELLHADYVQAAHHGNHAQSHDFFISVNPSVVFLDGPEWLMTGEDYAAKDFLVWCNGHGITTYDYRQAPTTLVLR